jgi:hypothetical protein
VLVLEASSGKTLHRFEEHLAAIYQAAFSDDGALVASADFDGELLVHDTRSGALLGRYSLPGTKAWALSFSPDGRFIAVSASVPRLVRRADGAELQLTNIVIGDGHFVLLHTAQGLFTGDDQAFSKVFFRVGEELKTAQLLSADQLFEQFHRPSLLEEFLSGRPVTVATGAIAQLGAVPGIAFAASPPATTKEERLKLSLRVTDRGGGVESVRVFVNGARADGGRGLKRAGEGLHEVEVTLVPGANLIEAEAYNVKGGLGSGRISARVVLAAEAAARPALYVLAITLDQYADPAQPLSYANADGDAVVKALLAQQGRLYAEVNVLRLRDAEATRPAIEAAAQKLAAVTRPGDVLVVYAAGHGMTLRCGSDPQEHYTLVTYRASLRSEKTLCEHGLSDARLAELLRVVPARKKLLLLDTCQAGAAATESTLLAMRGAVEIDAIKRLARSEGFAIVAAAKAAEYAGEVRALGHGIFTQALLDGLKGTGGPKDAAVTVFGLLGYLGSAVPELSEKYLGRPQFPISSTQGQDFPLALP